MAGQRLIGELTRGDPVLTDGAWGTELQRRGLEPGEMPDAWNLSHPDRVEAVARPYAEAGSRIVLTNTFRANRIAFAGHADVDRIAAINRAGVEISKRAAGDEALVFASIGPSGKQLITREVTEAQLAASGVDVVGANCGTGVADYVPTCARLAAATALPIWIKPNAGIPQLVTGEVVYQMTAEEFAGFLPKLEEAGASFVGGCCGTDPSFIAALRQRLAP